MFVSSIFFSIILHFGASSYTKDPASFCGEMLIGFSGYIISPGYPNNYTQNLSCVWFIMSDHGYRIQFQCHEFQLQSRVSDSKCIDYLQIKDMVTERIIFEDCGSVSPFDVTSDSNEVMVYLYSDDVDQYKGFILTWGAEEDLQTLKYVTTETNGKKRVPYLDKTAIARSQKGSVSGDILTPILLAVTFIGMLFVGLCLCILKRTLGRMRHSQEFVKQTLEVIKTINTGTYTHLDPDLRRTQRVYASPTQISDNVGTAEETIYMEFESQL